MTAVRDLAAAVTAAIGKAMAARRGGRASVGLIAVWAMLGTGVGGCEGVKQDLGIGVKRPPDEFAVYSRAPLSMPPDFGLRPPAPGAGTDSYNARAQAKDVLRGEPAAAGAGVTPSAALAAESPGTLALLDRTGGLKAGPAIREQVNRESTVLAEADQSFVERLMFWRDKPEEGTVVDAAQEARRIRENQALGQPIVTGETPTIERRPRSPLEEIF
jgi:hypothetical protein